MQLRRKQQGFWGLVYVLGTLGFVVFVILKIQPIYMNEMKLARAVKAVAADSSPSEESTSIKNDLQKWWNLEDIEIVKPADVKLKPGAGGKVLAYDYWNQVELFKNIYLSFHFVGEYPVGSSSY